MQKANSYASKVTMERDGEVVNAKSVLSVLALDARWGAKIRIVTEGPDENEAITGLVDLVKSNFGEE